MLPPCSRRTFGLYATRKNNPNTTKAATAASIFHRVPDITAIINMESNCFDANNCAGTTKLNNKFVREERIHLFIGANLPINFAFINK